MGLFGNKNIPPDIGNEEISKSEENEVSDETEEEIPTKKKKRMIPVQISEAEKNSAVNASNVQFEKINAQLEAAVNWIKNFQERFADINEKIGELRSSTLNNEKEIGKIIASASRAVDLVNEVQPEKLRIDFQKLENRNSELLERIEGNKEYCNTIMEELKELKRKSEVFVGVDALIKLNEDTKKDLVNLQKLSSKVKMHSDKVEQFFIELKGMIAESQRLGEKVESLDNNYNEAKKMIEGIRIDYSNIIRRKDFESFAKSVNSRFLKFDDVLEIADRLEKENERLAEVIETTLGIAEKNKIDIDDIAMSIGKNSIEKAEKYEKQLSSVLNVVDELAGEVSELKKRIGEPSKRNLVNQEITPIEEREKIKKDLNEIHSNENRESFNKKEIKNLLVKGESVLDSKKYEDAKKYYQKIAEIYPLLNKEEGKQIYLEIISFYKKILEAEKK